MYIESITMKNFKCFGEFTKITFIPGITGFVGDNGSGKTSTLEALKRMFSPISSERKLQLSDVYFGPHEDSQSITEKEITIDIVFGFDDSVQKKFESTKNNSEIQFINDIFFSGNDGKNKVRLILEGHYRVTESDTEDIDSKIYSVITEEEVPFGPEDVRKIPLNVRPTKFAEIFYVQAHRDASAVTNKALRNLLKKLERFADWDNNTKNQSRDIAINLENELNKVPAIKFISKLLRNYWNNLHDNHFDSKPIFSVVAKDFDQLIRELTLRFEKSPGGGQRKISELSEGQISLLYFAISATVLELMWNLDENSINSKSEVEGFKSHGLPSPLIIFALEEPENHLAPFYLPRMINLLNKLIELGIGQSFVTSHSTSVLSRLDPKNIRFFRNDRHTLVSKVSKLPTNDDLKDGFNFLNQVLLSNPEIYFARLIIIGEGDSERILIPRIAEAFNIPLDPSFIAYVSIGGRHAQHLWRLASILDIPVLTLLDFDLGRTNGGMNRIEDAIKWKEEIGIRGLDDTTQPIPDNKQVDSEEIQRHINLMRDNDVFYSFPLDIDMMMIKNFPNAYKQGIAYTPLEKEEEKDGLIKSVYKEGKKDEIEMCLNENISEEDLFVYRRLFSSRSKPVSHHVALSRITNKEIRENCPEPIKELIFKADSMLKVPQFDRKHDSSDEELTHKELE